KVRRSKISHVFISHMHGDHYFGLVGLINTFGLLSHMQELHIFGPEALQQIIEMQLKMAQTFLPYPLHFHAVTQNAVLVDDDKMRVKCFRTDHRIQCFGFTFEEKTNKRKILPEQAQHYQIPLTFYSSLQNGLDYTTPGGEVIKNEWVTLPHEKGKSYAFCADTRYDESMIEHFYGFDAIY